MRNIIHFILAEFDGVGQKSDWDRHARLGLLLACSRFYSVLGTVPAISLERINLGTKFDMQMKYDEYQLKDGKQFWKAILSAFKVRGPYGLLSVKCVKVNSSNLVVYQFEECIQVT